MILTVTLNPALDRILFVKSLTVGNTNRIYRREDCIGGKGSHVSFNLANLGVPSVATGVCMGENGRIFMDSLISAGVTCDFYTPEGGNTRENYIIVGDDGFCTPVCEKGPSLTTEMLAQYLAFYTERVQQADYVVIAGDASNYTGSAGSSFQTDLLNIGKAAGARVILDANGASLKEGVTCAPFLIKPNTEELQQLTGMPVDTDEQIIEAIRTLDPYGIDIIAVSRGGRGSIVRCFERYFAVGVADVQLKTETGCGDAYMSGLICGLINGADYGDMLTFAAACGGAMAENPLTVGLDAARAKQLQSTVPIRELCVG